MSNKTKDDNINNNENLDPSKACSTEDPKNRPDSNFKTVKQPQPCKEKQRRVHIKQQQTRRKKWWYFNRGLQPISEVVENKDDVTYTNESAVDILRDLEDTEKAVKVETISGPNGDIPSCPIKEENPGISQSGYSACIKLIEKFQEAVLDSAVRVIQAAFKRFRERRRFLKLKKAATVIQRNFRKWLAMRHMCLGPGSFDRQRSGSSMSDEYRETTSDFIDEDVGDRELPMKDNCEGCFCYEHYADSDVILCECSLHLNNTKNGDEERGVCCGEADSSEDCDSLLSDRDEGFSSMDALCSFDCCCIIAELSGGLCRCTLPTGFGEDDSNIEPSLEHVSR
ncbi:uncharacterized protein LOC5517978 [Nematostella vectensis]|uniref:uncharacterized protein LOC5517978 n=1 Tax=Nematostella vectensis TaxID=45351 RepID=UPI00207726C2|nr:uncharacterized protein LOC5517978 [Nematostella vectensis]